jgi:hypothetical protein
MNIMLEQEYNKYKNANLPEWEQWAVDNIKNLKNFLNQPANEKDWQIFIDNTIASDKFRNVNIKDYIPWMEGKI